MPSYKIPLLLAKPAEFKFLNAYASKIGCKVVVDNPGFVGFVKEINEGGILKQYDLHYPQNEDALPPDVVSAVPGGVVQVVTQDNLESKKSGISQLYIWAMKLEASQYLKSVFKEIIIPDEIAILEVWLDK